MGKKIAGPKDPISQPADTLKNIIPAWKDCCNFYLKTIEVCPPWHFTSAMTNFLCFALSSFCFAVSSRYFTVSLRCDAVSSFCFAVSSHCVAVCSFYFAVSSF